MLPFKPGGRVQYLNSHWRGEHPWGQIVLINLLVFRWGVELFASLGFWVFLTLSISVLVWQVTGSLRAAPRALNDSSGLYSALAIYSGVLFVVAWSAFQIFDVAARQFTRPELTDVSEPRLLEISEDGRTVDLSGNIDFSLNAALKATLRAHPSIRAIDLNSEGGNVFAGRAIALTIASSKLATQVTDRCYSACTLAFMAGEQRSVDGIGELGFHGYAFDNSQRVQTFDVNEQESLDGGYFLSRGVTETFVNRVFKTDASGLWKPNRRDLEDGGVITTND